MLEPPFPPDEQSRLQALRDLQILDTDPEQRFDRITRIAKELFDVPIALISLVDTNRQWFKSCQGLNAQETPRNISFCGHAILSEGILVVPNALEDARFADNPLVQDAPHIRFYAGAPLHTNDHCRIGTLCIIDQRARDFSNEELKRLRDLADWVQDELNRLKIDAAISTIRDKDAYLHAVLETMGEGMLVADDRGSIRSANYAAEIMFGYPRGSLPGTPISALLPDYQAMAAHHEVDGVFNRPVTGAAVRRNGDVFPAEWLSNQLKTDGEWLGIITARDISEREQVDKLKDQFVSAVSHELRTPLTSIRGALGLLAGGKFGELGTQAKDLVSIACRNSERLVRLVNDILDMEKIASGQMRMELGIHPLLPLIRDAIGANESFAREFDVTIRFECTDTPADAVVDPDRFQQIMTNLLSNAVKFSPGKGIVEVHLRSRSRPSGEIEHEISVQDHGPGIPEKFRPEVFNRFAQAENAPLSVSGTGLGLCIAKALVERFQGHIGFETETDVGTRFYFTLPAA